MKIVLIIYGISWLIILIACLNSFLNKKNKKDTFSISKDEDPWYMYVIAFLIAPVVVLAIPFILISNRKEEKARQKRNAKWEEEKKKAELEEKEIKTEFKSNSIPLKDYAVLNECVLKGKEIVELARSSRYSELFGKLDAVSLSKGLSLQVEECKTQWPAGESKLYVLDMNDSTKREYDIFKHLRVDDSYVGAWQVYLLYNLWHILPLFQHSIYASRTPIFDIDGLQEVKTDYDINTVDVKEDYEFYPIISKGQDKYIVSACYWTSWGGLIRELVTITIKDNKVVYVNDVSHEVEYEYECGIRF